MVRPVKYEFLSNEWFAQVDELIAKAGDLQIPSEMKAVEVNITVKSPAGDKQIFLKDGLFSPGHQPSATTKLTLDEALARKIFIDADAAAGVQAFMTGEMQVEGARNFTQPRWVSLLSRALNFQIEHHLFPRLPPNRLREIAPRVRAICEQHGVKYRSSGWGSTLRDVLGKLRRFSSPKAAPVMG